MTVGEHLPDGTPTDEAAEGGPVIRLSKPIRAGVATLAGGLAAAHVIWPGLPIDATSLGLVAVAVIALFFDIESIDALGIHARARARRLARAAKDVEVVQLPTEPVPLLPPPTPPTIAGQTREPVTVSEAVTHPEPADLTPPIDPAERLVWATEQIRVELIVLAGNSGNLPGQFAWHQYETLQLGHHLANKTLVPAKLLAVLPLVVEARNDLVHGAIGSQRVLAQADQLALDLLERLREIKRTWVLVLDPDVTVYRDQSLTSQLTAGVLLVGLDDAGKVIWRQVHPRARPYVRGRFVSWEWDMRHAFQEAWYQDSATKTQKLAWSGSATFIGREYPQQWGLEYRLSGRIDPLL